MSEFVGYRVNANTPDIPNTKQTGDGFVTVYAERRNIKPSLGEYGGDAYPVSYAVESADGAFEYGMILAADGVGQGAFTHPSLQSYLERYNTGVDEGDETFAKLSCFLRSLYGSALFEVQNSDALAYAVRCFADVPADGFFISPDQDGWKSAENAQIVMPFFKRDSQSLGSRILCVYIYYNFRHYMRDNKINSWDVDSAKALREEIQDKVRLDLAPRIGKLFDLADAENTTKQMRYFLCSTVAVWFYARNAKTNRISALSLNCGDARTYVVNGTDGVRQISVDDAFSNGSMKGFFHFGSSPKQDGDFCDNTLFARIVEAEAPCVLFACSDGVYDTCPGAMPDDGKKLSLPYGETTDANDFLFAVNMLAALRRSYSFEDFKREVVFNFYAQNSAQGVFEAGEGGSYAHVKCDDSGTLAARFFGKESPLEILSVLRENKHTALDELYHKLKTFEKNAFKIPYYEPHVQSATDAEDEEKSAYATGAFMEAMQDVVKAKYPVLFESMAESGAQTIWGAPHPSTAMYTGFQLNKNFVKVLTNYESFLNLAVADWRELAESGVITTDENGVAFAGVPQDWKAHEHVICDADVFQVLVRIKFEERCRQFASGGGKVDKTADVMLRLYGWFEERFFGHIEKTRKEVWTVDDDGRKSTEDTPAPEEIVEEILGETQREKTEDTKEAEGVLPAEETARESEENQPHEPGQADGEAPNDESGDETK